MTKQAGIRAGILKKTVIAVKPEPMTIALDEPFVPIVVLIGICPVHSVDCPTALLRSLGCIATPRKLHAVTRCDTVADGIESVLVHPFHQLFAKTLPANRVHEDVDLLRNIQSSHLEVPSAFGKLCLPPLLLSINIADWHTSKQKNTI